MSKQALLVILKNIEEGNAILVTQDGREIIWPQEYLPPDTKLGERLVIDLSRESEAEYVDNPKEFLNSILSLDR